MWGNGYGLRKSDPWRPNFSIDKKKRELIYTISILQGFLQDGLQGPVCIEPYLATHCVISAAFWNFGERLCDSMTLKFYIPEKLVQCGQNYQSLLLP